MDKDIKLLISARRWTVFCFVLSVLTVLLAFTMPSHPLFWMGLCMSVASMLITACFHCRIYIQDIREAIRRQKQSEYPM